MNTPPRIVTVGCRLNTCEFEGSRLRQTEDILVEAPWVGRSAHYMETTLPNGLQVGSVVRFTPSNIEDRKLVGHAG